MYRCVQLVCVHTRCKFSTVLDCSPACSWIYLTSDNMQQLAKQMIYSCLNVFSNLPNTYIQLISSCLHLLLADSAKTARIKWTTLNCNWLIRRAWLRDWSVFIYLNCEWNISESVMKLNGQTLVCVELSLPICGQYKGWNLGSILTSIVHWYLTHYNLLFKLNISSVYQLASPSLCVF